MKEVLKYLVLFVGLAIAGVYIYFLVTTLSQSTDIFAPLK